MKLTAERGANVETWIYVVDDKKEQSLLGDADARALGIVTLDLKGSPPRKSDIEVINKIEYEKLNNGNFLLMSLEKLFLEVKHKRK